LKELERERETRTATATEGLKLFEDTTANERYYARSLNIRHGAMDLMKQLADLSWEEKPVPYESLEDLGMDCANWVKKGRWDRKAAGVEAGTRWAKQYLSRFGPFKPETYLTGFIVVWRKATSRDEVVEELARFRKK
jgi:hypothetical protein